MKRIWFRRKTYGWGWHPNTWEGWVTTIVFGAFIIWNSFRTPNFFPENFIAVVLLIAICYATGETPRWQWPSTTDRERSAYGPAKEKK